MVMSLELFQVIKVASDGRITTPTPTPLFQSSQLPILFLRGWDSHYYQVHREWLYSLRFVLEDLSWKAGEDVSGPLHVAGIVWESRIHRFWQMYTHSRKSESVLGYCPAPSRRPSSQADRWWNPWLFKLQNLLHLIYHRT